MVTTKKNQFVNLPSIAYILWPYRLFTTTFTISRLYVLVFYKWEIETKLKYIFALKLVLHLITLYTAITTL